MLIKGIILFVVVMTSFSCNSKGKAKEVPIQFNDIPNLVVRNDDPLIQFKDSVYLYGNKPFSGYLINSLNQFNRIQYGYFNGLQEGIQQGWHFEGNLSFEYFCKEGIRIGEYKEYYPNGNLQIAAQYNFGKEIKKKILDINGKVIANYTLKDGRYYGLLGSSNCMTILEDKDEM